MSASKVLDLAVEQGLLDAKVIAELRKQIADSKFVVTPEAIAKILVDHGHLTPFQARKLVTSALGQPEPAAATASPPAAAKTSTKLQPPHPKKQDLPDEFSLADDDGNAIDPVLATPPPADDIIDLEPVEPAPKPKPQSPARQPAAPKPTPPKPAPAPVAKSKARAPSARRCGGGNRPGGGPRAEASRAAAASSRAEANACCRGVGSANAGSRAVTARACSCCRAGGRLDAARSRRAAIQRQYGRRRRARAGRHAHADGRSVWRPRGSSRSAGQTAPVGPARQGRKEVQKESRQCLGFAAPAAGGRSAWGSC